MATPALNQPHPPPLAGKLMCSVREACDASGFSPQTLYRWMADGRLETRFIQRRRRIVVSSLLKILELEPEAGPGTAA
jgi:hypothetical protein